MKRYCDYTNEELLALSDEEVERLIDIEALVENVPLLPKEPEKPDDPKIEPDVIAYEIRSFIVGTKEDADAIVEMINSMNLFDTFYHGGGYSWSGPEGLKPREDPIQAVAQKYWSNGHYQAHCLELKRRKEAKTIYDNAKKEFDEISRSRQTVVDRVWNAVSEAKEDKANRETIKQQFRRYVDLADGNEDMALTFYLNATSFHEDFVRLVLNKPDDRFMEEPAAEARADTPTKKEMPL